MSSKISVATIVADHWRTLRNRKGRVPLFDLFTFLILPTAISAALYYFGITVGDTLASILATAFSIFAALLFNLLLLVYDLLKKEEASSAPNKVRRDVLDDVSKNISFCILLALMIIIFLIINSAEFEAAWVREIVSAVTFWLSTIFLLTLFMVLKRIHNLLVTTFNSPQVPPAMP